MKHENARFTTFSKGTKRVSSILGPVLLGSVLVLLTVLLLLALPAGDINAQSEITAHVVIQFDDGTLWVRTIQSTDPISGAHALAKTNLEFEQMGELVCSIEGIGCPASDCFCPDNLWTQSLWDGSGWQQPWPFPNLQDGDVWSFAYNAGWPPDLAPATPLVAVADGLAWLATQQSADDGGYGTANESVESLFAVAANGYAASEWQREPDSPSLGGHVLSNGATFANSTAAASGKLAAGLVAGASCWPLNATRPMSYYQASTGAYSSTNDSGAAPHAWGMLGTIALSDTVPNDAIQYLKDMQQANGGWEWGIGWGTDTNATAMAIQALIVSGEPTSSGVIQDALDYLQSTQNTTDAGFPYNPDGGWPGAENSDTNSTAYAVQAIVAAGEDPTAAPWVMNNTNPISFLLSMQLGDGSFEWRPGLGASQIATQQAIPALLGRPIPLEVGELDRCWVQWLPVILEQ